MAPGNRSETVKNYPATHLVPNFGQGGVCAVARMIVKKVPSARGGKIICWSGLPISENNSDSGGVFLSKVSTFGKLLELRSSIKRFGSRKIICHSFRLAILARIARPRSILVLVVHTPISGNTDLRKTDRFFIHLALAASNQVVVVSRGIGDDLARLSPKGNSKRVTVINNAPQLAESFRLVGSDYPKYSEASSDLVDIWWVGRFAYQKDPLLAAQVVSAIGIEFRSRFRFIMAGSGELSAEVENHFNNSGFKVKHDIPNYQAGSGVYLAGYQQNWQQICYPGSIFLCTSRWEGHPLVLIEAICVGLKVFTRYFKYGLEEVQDALSRVDLSSRLMVLETRSNQALIQDLASALELEIEMTAGMQVEDNPQALRDLRSYLDLQFEEHWEQLLAD